MTQVQMFKTSADSTGTRLTVSCAADTLNLTFERCKEAVKEAAAKQREADEKAATHRQESSSDDGAPLGEQMRGQGRGRGLSRSRSGLRGARGGPAGDSSRGRGGRQPPKEARAR